MKSLTPFVAAAVIATSAFNIAGADVPGEARSQIVRFADLDIHNPAGAAILYRRLKSAAENVCRELEPGRSLVLVAPYRACVHTALGKALADSASPAVLAYAASRGTAANVTLRIAKSE